MTQKTRLHEALKENPEGISLQDIRNNLFIMNPMEAVRQLREERIDVETFEFRRTSNNRPVSGYRLRKKRHDTPFNSQPIKPEVHRLCKNCLTHWPSNGFNWGKCDKCKTETNVTVSS